jgi:2,3-bisphosphoglycerate-independent phosphoglycerate mutase
MFKPIVLCVLDGWGHRTDTTNNAIALANTPNWDRWQTTYPHTLLQASEGFVGLPDGQMGNSEVGHTNIGAGRIVRQDLPRIDHAIKTGKIAQNQTLLALVMKLKETGGTCHVMGLLSPGGVHSHQNHILALCEILKEHGVPVVVHAFLDGRDVPPKSALDFFEEFRDTSIATVTGRFYAMDRDNRWDRTELAYNAIINGQGEQTNSPQEAIENGYTQGVTDEFIKPTVIGNYKGVVTGLDGFIMANFRADRARQLMHTLVDPVFDRFEHRKINWAAKASMTSYSAALDPLLPQLFPPIDLTHTLGEEVSNHGGQQLRIAETEKYAHVTFFFNGGREEPFTGEDRILVPSPKVKTYDEKPEMSAFEVTDQLIKAMNKKDYNLIIVNYANTDMVGHTGDQVAAIKAVETVDVCLGKLEKAVLEHNGILLVTADHGNAEVMKNPQTGQSHTAHTLNPVPFVYVSANIDSIQMEEGRLADIAPTILHLMDYPKPDEMTGKNLMYQK